MTCVDELVMVPRPAQTLARVLPGFIALAAGPLFVIFGGWPPVPIVLYTSLAGLYGIFLGIAATPRSITIERGNIRCIMWSSRVITLAADSTIVYCDDRWVQHRFRGWVLIGDDAVVYFPAHPVNFGSWLAEAEEAGIELTRRPPNRDNLGLKGLVTAVRSFRRS